MLSSVERAWLIFSLALALGIFAALTLSSYASLWPVAATVTLFALLLAFAYRTLPFQIALIALVGFTLALRSQELSPELRDLQPWALEERRRYRSGEKETPEFAEKVKAEVARRITLGLEWDARRSKLARSMMLGERALMSKEDKDVFVNAGTLHAFAVSGLHVGVVALVIRLLLLAVGISHRVSAALTIPIMWGYVYLVGMTSSATRAGAMASVLLLSPVFFRRYNLIAAWGLAFWIFHSVSPEKLLEVGSALSFTITLMIVVWVRCFERECKSIWYSSVMLSFVIWAASVPIMAHVFGRFTPGGLIANVFVVPLASLAIASLSVALPLSFVSTALASHLNNLAGLALGGMYDVSKIVASIPYATVEVVNWNYFTCALWYSALILLVLLIHSISKHKYGIIHL
ncbi:MAG: ComEC/Rec2 family competence protein [Kiritimatiellae bacterium]|nr:ComEC/Rec2 family competence protein [Kiritimatiellia bacterium]